MAYIQKIVNQHAITTAQTIALSGKEIKLPDDTSGLTAVAVFDSGTGGTNAKVYIQTSFDSGTTWFDIMCITFTTSDATKILSVNEVTAIASSATASAGALSDDTAVSGVIGNKARAMVVTTGTYAGASLNVWLRIE